MARRRTGRLRIAARTTALVAVMALPAIAPAAAQAWASFGTVTYSNPGNEVGVNANIVVGSTQWVGSDGLLLQRAVVQSAGSYAGLAQAGTIITGSQTGLDNCGTRTSHTAYTEFKQSGQGNNTYWCYYANAISPGAEYAFSVCHYDATYNNSWYTTENGGMINQAYLGFNTAFPAAGGELNGPTYDHPYGNGYAIATYRSFQYYLGNYCSIGYTLDTGYSFSRYAPADGWSSSNPVGGVFYVAH